MLEFDPLLIAFADLHSKFMRTLDRRMAQEGASFAKTKLLLVLRQKGPLRATDIAEYLGQSPRTVTEAIDGLERDGLVKREPDPSDRRAKMVVVTQSGLDATARTEPLRLQIVEQTFGTLLPQERESFGAVLEKLSRGLPSD